MKPMDFPCPAREAAAVRRELARVAARLPWPEHRAAFAAFLRGGKLLRARLFLAHAPRKRAGRIRTAAGLELLHAASLVHDDIVDGDRQRRGGGAAWTWAGTGGALLIGDWLVAQALRRLPADGRAAELVGAMAAAEIRHLAGDRDAARYRRDKTARLFAYAAELAAPGNAALRRRALAFGMAFQAADDAADGDA